MQEPGNEKLRIGGVVDELDENPKIERTFHPRCQPLSLPTKCRLRLREIRNELRDLAAEVGEKNYWLRRELISSAVNVTDAISWIDGDEEKEVRG